MLQWKEKSLKQLKEIIEECNKRRTTQLEIPPTQREILRVLRANKKNELFQDHVTSNSLSN